MKSGRRTADHSNSGTIHEPSLGLFGSASHAEGDASGVSIADGRDADLIQISGQLPPPFVQGAVQQQSKASGH